MSDIYVDGNGKDPYKMLEKLSLGYTHLWPEVAAHANQGNLRVYDTLRGLEEGLEASVKRFNEAIDDNGGHKDYWESQKRDAYQALEALKDKNNAIIEYNGISLAKK